MVATQNPLMRPKVHLLRVFSVKRTSEPQEAGCPTPETWEVRADTGSPEWMSLFYTERSPQNLPPVDSLIRVTVDDRLTDDIRIGGNAELYRHTSEVVLDTED